MSERVNLFKPLTLPEVIGDKDPFYPMKKERVMTAFSALRKVPSTAPWKKGDVLVLFGELFQRGYANGLVEEAEKHGLTVVRATVGRRERDGILRPLTAEEMAVQTLPFINVPLEAGFDLEPDASGQTPIDQLKDVKLSDWASARIDFSSIEDSRQRGVARFRRQTEDFLKELRPLIPPGANVLFAHLMAGGVPRTKLVMPLINRVVKGTGDRYIPSETLWNSEIGKFIDKSFREVTAETFHHLVDLSSSLRQSVESTGGRVSYLAYGYHGTEILIDDRYQWQTYTPYVQGWAKMRLEDHARAASAKGIHACVYNCPEILTNSSSIFQGVELSLYPLLEAFTKEVPKSEYGRKLRATCAALLHEGEDSLAKIREMSHTYFTSPTIKDRCQFEAWPQHTTREQLEMMLKLSDDMMALHKDSKSLMTAILSESVFEACGRLMFHDAWEPETPVSWIGHDVIAKALGAE